MKRFVFENIIKNIVICVLLALVWLSSKNVFAGITDNNTLGSILIAVSVIAVIACFGNFAFTYEKINPKATLQRALGHLTTGLLMLVIGISLILTANLMHVLVGKIFIIDLTLGLLYIACIGYDFWDLYRIHG